jgi:HTH-type transcriptional repressor of NAD biosynthesis genes
MTRGLVFGKFHPPHRGHKYLIDAAAARCDHLTVLLMASVRETIPAAVRLAWLREIHPHTDIRLVPDEMPQSWTADRDDLFREFAELVHAHHPEPLDVLFTSEWYGDLTARWLGCRHVAIDPMRASVHISSTLIRESPTRYLDALAPAVRAWCVPRIVLVGAESTGKTVLAGALAARFGAPWVPEFGRDYCAWVGQTATTRYAFTPQDFTVIGREQQRREDAAARTAAPVLICDTDAVATGIWQRRYLGADVPLPDAAVAGRRLYLFCQTDHPFVQDGTRDGEAIRERMNEWFETKLAVMRATVTTIAGPPHERYRQAVAAVERACTEPIPLVRAESG